MKKLLLLLAVVLLSACSAGEVLLRDLTERDANEIIATLYYNQIQSSKNADAKGKTFAVLVAKDDLAAAVSVLHAVGLPRENRQNLNEIFKSNGFAPTAFEERVRFAYGTSQELERTISYMDGVLTARVHVVIPEKAYRREQQNAPSASVFVSYDDKVPFEAKVPAIRKLVSDSIENLDPVNVNILATPTKVDLAKVVNLQLVSFMGMKVQKDSLPILSGLIFMLLVLLGVSAYYQRALLLTYFNKCKELVWKMYP